MLSWEIGCKGSGLWVEVPAGFLFDVSVPRGLWWAMSPHDPKYLRAAALHDYLLSLGWDRVTSAAAFAAGLKASRVGKVRRLVLTVLVIAWRWT